MVNYSIVKVQQGGQLLRYHKQISLHDGLFRRVIADRNARKLVFELRCGDLQAGYYDLDLTYLGVEYATLDVVALAGLVRDRQTEILYDELDFDGANKYIHRILFHPAGEIAITFSNISLKQRFQPNRSVPDVGDPYQEVH